MRGAIYFVFDPFNQGATKKVLQRKYLYGRGRHTMRIAGAKHTARPESLPSQDIKGLNEKKYQDNTYIVEQARLHSNKV
jgi:hypothetical protein